MAEPQPTQAEELLDEESLAVLAILLAVSLEFGFGFAKTVDWWAGLDRRPRCPRNARVALPATAKPCLARPRRRLGRPDPLPPVPRRR